jgi:alginate O-acetyltransferase complex protein AlgI
VFGFYKKLYIADKLGVLVDIVFTHPEAYSRTSLTLGLLGYTVQIWADFSGYTDMGRGAALMLGIRLPENFLSPYLARSPSEFWRRWHVSLSEWIRDYIYIPLGGSRGGALRALGVVVLTMTISGFWHGARWHFAAWGLYHGALLVAERRLNLARFRPRADDARLAFDAALGAGTFAFVALGWLLFRAESFSAAGVYLAGILRGGGAETAPGTFKVYPMLAFCLLAQAALYTDLETAETPLSRLRARFARPIEDSSWAGLGAGLALAAIFVGTIAMAGSYSPKSFIYFQF